MGRQQLRVDTRNYYRTLGYEYQLRLCISMASFARGVLLFLAGPGRKDTRPGYI